MATDTTARDLFSRYYANPGLIIDNALDLLGDAVDGKIDIPDPGNAFIFLLEASATMASAAMVADEVNTRKAYPVLAQTYDDLYNHMSDADYLDRFATPNTSTVTMVIPVDTVRNVAVSDVVTGNRKLTIPKHTQFTVGGMAWCTHRPIDMLVSDNGVVQVVYDLSYDTPLLTTNTNILDQWFVTRNGVQMLVMQLPVQQASLTTITEPVSISTGFHVTLPFDNLFYHVNAYHRTTGAAWLPMKTTHSAQTYDVLTPTLLAKVSEGILLLDLPSIYMSNGTIGEEVRIDLYTTMGDVSFDFGDYAPDDFGGQWQDLDNPNNPHMLPLSTVTDMVIFSDAPISGGREPLTFEELRNRVIYRSNDIRASITFKELAYKVSDMGYTLRKSKDTITDRMFICSRGLPAPVDNAVSTPCGVLSGYVSVDSRDKTLSSDVLHINKTITTLTDKALFKEVNGTITVMSEVDVKNLISQDIESLARELNTNTYLYTPYHYVMDPAEGMYITRIYDFNTATTKERTWVYSNRALDFSVSTYDVSVTYTDTVFTITLKAVGPDWINEVWAQLEYTDPYGHIYHLTAAESFRDGAAFEVSFELRTSLDIDHDDGIEIVNMLGVDNVIEDARLPINSTMDIYYFQNDGLNDESMASVFDDILDQGVTVNPVGITHEQTTVVFGSKLNSLASRSKANVIPAVPLRHMEDVVERYSVNVLARDGDNNLVYTIDPTTGKPVFDVDHAAGGIVYDVDGKPKLVHRAGDVVLDSTGVPMLAEDERLAWEISPLLLDAKYRFVTEAAAVKYRDRLTDSIYGFIRDVESLKPDLLERTQVVFQPNGTLGNVPCKVNGDRLVVLDSALTFRVKYMLNNLGYGNTSARDSITAAARVVIMKAVASDTIAMGNLTRALMVAGGEYTLDVNVDNVLQGWDNAKIQTEGSTFSVKSLIKPMSNGTLAIVDDVEVSFYTEVL